MSFELSADVKTLEEMSEKLDARSDEVKPRPSKPKCAPNDDGDDRDEESYSSELSDSTVLYLMNSSGAAGGAKGKTTDLEKEVFFSSDLDSSNCSSDHGVKITKDVVLEEVKNIKEEGEKRKKPKEEFDTEEKELEKLLRMTEMNPSTRSNTTECNEKGKVEKEGPKDKKSSKTNQEEVSLLDCLDSENCEGNGNPDTVVGEDGNTESDFYSLVNNQIKESFLVSSDESCQSSAEADNEKKTETKKKITSNKTGKSEKAEVKKKKDDLSEFRVPNLSPDVDKEEEEEVDDDEVVVEDESYGSETSEAGSTKKDPTFSKKEECGEKSDDSVKCVQHVKKRKRANNSELTTDTDSGSDVQQVYCKTESSPSKGRKNIKKILKKDSLQVETKQALKLETERKKRVTERQKLFDALFPNESASSKLILDFDPQTKEELVVVDEELSGKLKPHQKEGVRFMWNCCFESLKQMEENSGSGCVLAHCMGLGKTLQVITLAHTVLTHNTGVQTVLIICPLNTIRNWTHEFRTWQTNCQKKIKPVDLIPCKNKHSRLTKVRLWMREGGVLVISYDMFRSLIKQDHKSSIFSRSFIDPGPDLVVCDEGHVLKNNNSALSKCISGIKTLRRIILTGTPLQNNLVEYYCMVQFVKPNILGTMKEFKNRFVHPINNGQFEDSTELDVLLMKRRSHVLHTMLDGFVQRFGYYVLTPFLPEKQEYVISISLTQTQENIYRLYIEQYSRENRGLLRDFHWLQKIWTHPQILDKHGMEYNAASADAENQWRKFVREEEYNDIRSSGKVLLLFEILRRSKEIGDKVLVFSQSLFSLNLIEYFFQTANREYLSGEQTEFADSWEFGLDYYRLDGSTSSEHRDVYCQKFNDAQNKRFRVFLISTKAGGLGISLVAANRVVVFDASWNPTHDVQSIFRVYRFGQKKPCFIYRFLAAATMEEKIYKRQVTKLSLAHRILDEHQIERHYTMGNLQELYRYDPTPKSEWRVPKIPKDSLFAEILANNRDLIVGYHEHDSLLENKEEEELTEEERRAAWEDYEKEKLTPEQPLLALDGVPPTLPGLNGIPMSLHALNRINNEGLKAVQRYKQGISAVGQTSGAARTDNQMCRIVDVRTLQGGGAFRGRMEGEKLLRIGKTLGLRPFEDETTDRFYRRIEETLKTIFPWGIPTQMIRGEVNSINEL